MRAITIVVLLWVVVVLAVHSWRLFVKSMASGEMERWENGYDESLRKDFPRESK